MHIVRKLKTTELPLLPQLFNYKNFDEMIAENIRDIKNGIIDIFALFDGAKIIGQLRVKYICDYNRFTEHLVLLYRYKEC